MNLLYYQFKLQGSWFLGAVFLFVYSGSILTICFVSILWWIEIFLVLFVAVDCYRVVKIYALLTDNKSVVAFWYGGEGRWFLKYCNKNVIEAKIGQPSFISKNMLIINFILKNSLEKTSVIILRDMISRLDFKKLKLMLKIVAN